MRKSLFIGTALALIMGTAGAYAANGNSLYIDQTGDSGTATINQSGNNNQIGADGTYTRVDQQGYKTFST